MKLETEGIDVLSPDQQKTGLWDIAFLWFCANVAVPRLLIGGTLAGLGLIRAVQILIWGNILVIIPLIFLGQMGYRLRIPTMAASRLTFGVKGSYIPSIANSVQLIGWGAAVTVVCGSSINAVFSEMTGFENLTLWVVITAVVQLLITVYGFRSITWLQRASTPLLALLSVYVAYIILRDYGWQNLAVVVPASAISIAVALDILAGNAFAWGPMVCDYTRYSKNARSAGWGTLLGSVSGAAGFMFVGLVSGLATGDPNPSSMLVKFGLGVPALLIIILSSLTTNVLNLYSAAISFSNLRSDIVPWKIILIFGTLVGGVSIIPGFIGHFIGFLIFVGSIFVPLIAVMVVDFYVVKRQEVKPEELFAVDRNSKFWYTNGFHTKAIAVWLVGTLFYYFFPKIVPFLGSTIPCFIFTAILAVVVLKERKHE